MNAKATPHPKSIEDWRRYVQGLAGSELFEAASAANCIGFVETLEAEGYEPVEIHAIVHAFATRFAELGERPPMDGLYNLLQMARTPDPLQSAASH